MRQIISDAIMNKYECHPFYNMTLVKIKISQGL